jgi:hypothetical protein
VRHLLKWQFRRERIATAKHLRDNPGLKLRRQELLADSYDKAVQAAVSETDLLRDRLPQACPYTLDEIMDPEF